MPLDIINSYILTLAKQASRPFRLQRKVFGGEGNFSAKVTCTINLSQLKQGVQMLIKRLKLSQIWLMGEDAFQIGMPRGRKAGSKVTKSEPKFENAKFNDFSMSRISSFDSHLSSDQQFSEFQIEGSDDSLIEELALIPRRQITFNEFSDQVINLKVQERINVEQETDERYYIAKSKKPVGYENSKYEIERPHSLSNLLLQKLEHLHKKKSNLYSKTLYRIKTESAAISESDYDGNSEPRRFQQKQILQICD